MTHHYPGVCGNVTPNPLDFHPISLLGLGKAGGRRERQQNSASQLEIDKPCPAKSREPHGSWVRPVPSTGSLGHLYLRVDDLTDLSNGPWKVRAYSRVGGWS